DDRFDAIVTNAAGCGSTLKEYGDLLREDAKHDEAEKFAKKIKDITEFLDEIGLRPPARKLNVRATYQDPCHLAHGQRIRSAPRQLLRAVGLEVEEMPHSDQCCGSAGSYNVTQNELSMKVLDAKMNDIACTSAECCSSAPEWNAPDALFRLSTLLKCWTSVIDVVLIRVRFCGAPYKLRS